MPLEKRKGRPSAHLHRKQIAMPLDQKAIEAICQEIADFAKTAPADSRAIEARLSELTHALSRSLGLSETEIAEIDEQAEREVEADTVAEVTAALDALDKSDNPDAQAFGSEMRGIISAKLKRGVKGSA
jgi:hypothetical protein